MLRLLAPAVHGAELPDVQEVQRPEVHQGRELQGADHSAQFEPHSEVVRGRRVFQVRDVQEQEVSGHGGLERSASGAKDMQPLHDREDES